MAKDREQQFADDFLAFLARKKKKSATNYISAVRGDTLSFLFKDFLPPAGTLLSVDDPATFQGIREHFNNLLQNNQQVLTPQAKAYLRQYFRWKEESLHVQPPSEEETGMTTITRIPGQTAPKEHGQVSFNTSIPHHNFRLRTVMQVFKEALTPLSIQKDGKRDNDRRKRKGISDNDRFLFILTGDAWGLGYTSTRLSENNPAFSKLCQTALTQLENHRPEVITRLFNTDAEYAGVTQKQLKDICRRLTDPKLEHRGSKIEIDTNGNAVYFLLKDLTERSLRYEDSLLYQLEMLYQAVYDSEDAEKLANCYLDVIAKVLRDSTNDSGEYASMPKGVAMMDGRFWEGGLFCSWMEMQKESLSKAKEQGNCTPKELNQAKQFLELLETMPVPDSGSNEHMQKAQMLFSVLSRSLLLADFYLKREKNAGEFIWRGFIEADAEIDYDRAKRWLACAQGCLKQLPRNFSSFLDELNHPALRESLLPLGRDAGLDIDEMPENSPLQVQLLLRRDEMLMASVLSSLASRDPDQQNRNGQALMQILEDVYAGERICARRLDLSQKEEGWTNPELLEYGYAVADPDALRTGTDYYFYVQPAQIRLYLLQAKSHLILPTLEKDELAVGDTVKLYIEPCFHALCSAVKLLNFLRGENPDAVCEPFVNQEEFERLDRKWQDLCREAFNTFFCPGSFLDRLKRLPGNDEMPGDDETLLRPICARWMQMFPEVLADLSEEIRRGTYRAPCIILPLTDSDVASANDYDPIFSGAFDSVTAGADGSNPHKMELTIFHQVSVSHNILLQMNQITDNRSMLQLLHEPGFRWLARQGMISLSGFTRRYQDGSSYNADSPAAYLRMCLGDSRFQFSSTELYELPPVGNRKPSPRDAMLKYLKGEVNSRFVRECTPQEKWEELDFLLDSYRIAFEVFQPSDLRRYHQNPKRRFPAATQQTAHSLADVIRQRGEALREQNGRTACMEAFSEYIARWGHLEVRSEYKNAVDKALEIASESDKKYLLKFRSFVYDCYFLSNGKRSSRTVLLEQPDPELRLPDDRTISTKSERPRYSLHLQHKEPASDHSALNWDELTNIALLSRRLKTAYRTLNSDLIAERVSRETGIPCRAQNGDLVAVDMTVKTTQKTSEIIAAETSGSGETYQEVY